MNGYAASRTSFHHEEKLALIDERSLSDVESESGRVDLDGRFPSIRWVDTAKAYTKGLRLSAWTSTLLRTGIFLLPSFVQSRFFGRERNQAARKAMPTAYLDGMRGLAALFVFFCHYFYTAFHVHEGWGHGHNDTSREIWKLPFVRLLYSGPSMVCVFFIISGYALSLKPLKQIRARSFDGFANTMSSFAFRRGFRLFLPPVMSSLVVLLMLRAGLYETTRDFTQDRQFMHNVMESHPVLKETTAEQLRHWMWSMFEFMNIFSWDGAGARMPYDVHLWTIPVEFRCSMVLFLMLVATARLRTGVRFFAVACFSWFVLRYNRWEMVLFLCGMVLAELDLIRNAHDPAASSSSSSSSPQDTPAVLLPIKEKQEASLPQSRSPSPTPSRSRFPTAFLAALFSIPALYLMSQPDGLCDGGACHNIPGWEYLGTFVPEWMEEKYRFWQILGSALFVFCAARSPVWQRVFTSQPVQYLGRVSYAVYLMHGPVTHAFGYRVQRWMWSLTGTEDAAYQTGFVLAAMVNIPLVLWAADVFWRAVDAPIVRFTRWLEVKVSINE